METRPYPIQIPEHELELSYVRSSGPGGQNVNKVNSKAVLRWNFATCPRLSPGVRARFQEAFGTRLTTEGVLVLTSDRHRDQGRNREDCIQKLHEMLAQVAFPPKARRKTKPTRSSQKRRMDSKARRGETKAGRGRIRH